jgi:hypothetical protein
LVGENDESSVGPHTPNLAKKLYVRLARGVLSSENEIEMMYFDKRQCGKIVAGVLDFPSRQGVGYHGREFRVGTNDESCLLWEGLSIRL